MLSDLEEAIISGGIPAGGSAARLDGGWDITIWGVDSAGEGLSVMVRLSAAAAAPLKIFDFCAVDEAGGIS